MAAARSSPNTADHAGYASAAYAAALPHVGAPVALPRAQGWLLRRAILATDREDLVAPYPVLSCARWSELAADLAALPGYVSSTAVIDPLAEVSREELAAAFPDHLIEFKLHFLVDLTSDFAAARSSHHRRGVRRALREVEVERADDPAAHAAEWRELYATMAGRVGLRSGPADFPPASLDAQLAVPGMRYYRASIGAETVAACLWLRQEDRVYYHLGASRPVGYGAKASYALFDLALAEAATEGLRWASLGGVAGLVDDESDGLAFFKRGWATDSTTALLGGRVLDRPTYDALGGEEGGYFPAYRAGAAR